jgi:hypothetical protein
MTGGLDPNEVAGVQETQRVAVPGTAARADKAIAARFVPIALEAVAEGRVIFAVPGLLDRCRTTGRGSSLGFYGIEQPGSAEKLPLASAIPSFFRRTRTSGRRVCFG